MTNYIPKDGKTPRPGLPAGTRKPSKSKYTIIRDNDDLAMLESVRSALRQKHMTLSLKTDAELYRLLASEYLDAVKTIDQLQLQQARLTAKMEESDEIREAICRISSFAKGKKNHEM